jgi:hypothetical protein
MLAVMASNTEIVFVKLLDEGTDVLRPVPATKILNGVYKLLATDDYDPEFETWEFPPGSKVRCEHQKLDFEIILVAVELAEP